MPSGSGPQAFPREGAEGGVRLSRAGTAQNSEGARAQRHPAPARERDLPAQEEDARNLPAAADRDGVGRVGGTPGERGAHSAYECTYLRVGTWIIFTNNTACVAIVLK